MSEPRFAYISQSKLNVYTAGTSQEVQSPFARSLRERATQIHNRHAWKMQGRGAQFLAGMLWPAQTGATGEIPIAITGLAPGRGSMRLLYSLETTDVSGVFAAQEDGTEQRLFHTADFRVRYLALSPDGSRLAASILHNGFNSSISLMDVQGSGLVDATEGDSFDVAPRWVPGGSQRIVFQSAGIGRDAAGRFRAFGPCTVQELDLDSGDLECVAEEPGSDLLLPQKGVDGSLYFIRRPYETGKREVSVIGALRDAFLFPFRMAFAVFQYFNFFSMRYTGKPLTTARGAVARHPDLRQMMMLGNLAEALGSERDTGDSGTAALVPSSWQLVRRTPSGVSEVLAKNVLSFDVAADRSVLYSNGSAVYFLPCDGGKRRQVLAGMHIGQIVAL